MDDEKQTSIKVVDRRRFYLDDDGEVREKDPEEKVVDLSNGAVVSDRDEKPPERRRESWWNRLRQKFAK